MSTPPGLTLEFAPPPITFRQSDSDQRPIRIVPKGLRSFDEHDADFFLELLPGPQDREGLPDSLRFWKTRIETTDADKTFRVGLIYGPSGCGKSSLVKAGLLPRLAKQVLPVYIEATEEETQARLLKSLRKACPDLSPQKGFVDSLMAIRQGRVLRSGKSYPRDSRREVSSLWLFYFPELLGAMGGSFRPRLTLPDSLESREPARGHQARRCALKNDPVCDALQAATSSGVPVTTNSPPP